jgi:hypothetical protein
MPFSPPIHFDGLSAIRGCGAHGHGPLTAYTRVLRDNVPMVKSVEGIYRNGSVDLLEPLDEAEGSRVIVTWVHSPESIDLRERAIDERQAADLRRRLSTFAEDWDRPEMTVYDELPSRRRRSCTGNCAAPAA